MPENRGADAPAVKSADLRPGTRVRHFASGTVATLERRKLRADYPVAEQHTFLPGWWTDVERGVGLADFTIDEGTWTVVDPTPDLEVCFPCKVVWDVAMDPPLCREDEHPHATINVADWNEVGRGRIR